MMWLWLLAVVVVAAIGILVARRIRSQRNEPDREVEAWMAALVAEHRATPDRPRRGPDGQTAGGAV